MSNEVSKLIFKIDFVNQQGEETNLLTRDMLYPLALSTKAIGESIAGLPTKTQNVLQHSVQAIQIAEKINRLVRLILKDSTMDYIEKYRYSDVALRPFDTTDCYYKITLEDVNYPVFLSNGKRLMNIIVYDDKNQIVTRGTNNVSSENYINVSKYVDEKYRIDVEYVEQPLIILSSVINAVDYIYNPNFIPPFNKIWKDFYQINDPNPNSEYTESGLTKRTMTIGVRSLIKQLLNYNKINNAYTNPELCSDFINTYDGFNF